MKDSLDFLGDLPCQLWHSFWVPPSCKQNLVVDGTDLVGTIARIFTDTLGRWVGPVFLVSAALTSIRQFWLMCQALRSTAATRYRYSIFCVDRSEKARPRHAHPDHLPHLLGRRRPPSSNRRSSS